MTKLVTKKDINLIFSIEDNAPKPMYIKGLDAFCFFVLTLNVLLTKLQSHVQVLPLAKLDMSVNHDKDCEKMYLN
ncbi:hypothetical protein [Viridibacillus arvi]|uniref:hypothetical protein n=1 Tax=Viridibacillus arvi TaxID=263475 RepID=UPI0034CEC809